MSTRAQMYEKGAVIIMFTMYTFVFVTMVALAVNVYLIGNALMQQRNAVEYVGMAALKIANEQPCSGDDPGCPQCPKNADELTYLNCVLARAEIAGKVRVGNSQNSFHLVPGKLRVKARDNNSNSCCKQSGGVFSGCGPRNPGDDGPNGGDDDDDSDDDFCWGFYQIVDEAYAELVMGVYSVDPEGRGSFKDAQENEVKGGLSNAIKLRFHFDASAENTKLIAPLVGLFGKNMRLKFSSSALAYRTPDGSIQLAIDPTLSIGS